MHKTEVYVKVRGLINSEKESGASRAVKCGDDKVTVNDKAYQLTGFGAEINNEQLYKATLQSSVIQGLTKGIKLGVVCVGESKSGKSTVLGTANSTSPGLVSCTADAIFQHIGDTPSFVGVSYINVFQERFTDLLNPEDRELKVKSQASLGVYVESLSEIAVKSPNDLMRLFDQGNKVRKILELEMGIPSTKSHAIFTIAAEYKTKDSSLVRSQVQFYNVAGLNHSSDPHVSNSLKSLEALVAECVSTEQPTGYNGSKLTQLMRSVLDKSAYLVVLGHVSPTTQSIDTTTRTLEFLLKWQQIQLDPQPNTLDTHKLIEDLRRRAAAARNAITTQTSGSIPKEHIAELDSSLAALSAAKRLQWADREKASVLAEEQRRQTLADQGVLEWITETYRSANNSSSAVLLLQKDKDNLVNEYKKQRKIVDDLKTRLQGSINKHTTLANLPNQDEAVLQDSLTRIHKLRDQLKTGNDKLKDLKKGVKDAQDKLKLERSLGKDDSREIAGNFALTLMLKKDEVSHLKRDNEQFLEEEKERLQSEAEQDIAEIKLSATQGTTLTLEQVVELQEQGATQNTQLSHLALHVQCLQAENEKLVETVEALRSANKVETETQKARNLLTFRQYKDFYEEAKTATNAKYQELLNSCIQDCIFLSSRNAELTEENTDLKRKLKHFS